MGIVGKFLAVVLGAIVALSVGAWVLNATLWSASYMTAKAHESQLDTELAKALPEALAAVAGGSVADTKTVLEQSITPAFVRDQFDTLVPQLEAYYRHGGSVPTLDLRGLEAKITADGLPVPAGLTKLLDAPVAVSSATADPTLTAFSQGTAEATWLGPLVAGVLAALIFFIARRRRWLTLAIGAGCAALIALILAGLAALPPRFIASSVDTSPLHALTPATRHYAEVVASDQTHWLVLAAAALAGVAVVLAITHLLAAMLHRVRPKSNSHH